MTATVRPKRNLFLRSRFAAIGGDLNWAKGFFKSDA